MSFFVDTPAGLLKMELTTDAEEDVREVYACWASRQEPDYVNEIYALIKKKNQKELDPKFFDANERVAFNKSDVEEWKAVVAQQISTACNTSGRAACSQVQDHLSPDALCSNKPWSNELGGEV